MFKRIKLEPSESDGRSSDSVSEPISSCSDIDLDGGRPLQLIRFEQRDDGSTSLQLNEETLYNVMKTTENRPLSIISIAGLIRQGKSYLFNHIIRSLSGMENNKADWMNWKDPSKPLTGFNWRHGMQPVTKGIWIWSRAFLVDGNDDEIAVLLLDTQGFNEDDSPNQEITTIGLCVLLSSVTLLNFSNELPEDVFRSMTPILKFALHSLENGGSSDEAPLQKLLLLIRNWKNPSQHPFGMKDRNAYFQEKLKSLKARAKGKAGKEAKEICEAVESCFQSVNCWLLPNIGEHALRDSSTGAVADLSEEFAKVIEMLINEVISMEGLQIKKIAGNVVSANEFNHFLAAYVDMLNSWNDGELELSPEVIWDITGNVSHENTVRKSIRKFREVFDKRRTGKRYLLGDNLESGLAHAKRQAQAIFKKAEKLDEFRPKHERILEKELKEAVQNIREDNDKNRSIFVTQCIQNGSEFYKQSLDEKFPFISQNCEVHEIVVFYDPDAIKAEANYVEQSVKKSFILEFIDEEEDEHKALVQNLEEILQSALDSYLRRNSENKANVEEILERAVCNLLNEYKSEMDELLKDNPCVETSVLNLVHKATLKGKGKRFAELNMPGGIELKEQYENDLQNRMEQVYANLTRTQSVNIEETLTKALQLLGSQTEGYLNVLKKSFAEHHSVEELLEQHKRAIPNLKHKFDTTNPFPAGSSQREALSRKLEEELQKIYEQVVDEEISTKRKFKERCKNVLEQSFNLFTESFNKLIRTAGFLEEDVININHVNYSNEALSYFENFEFSSNESQKAIPEEYLCTLKEKIEAEFNRIQMKNHHAREEAITAMVILTGAHLKMYDEKMMISPSINIQTVEDLEQRHKQISEKVVQSFLESYNGKNKGFLYEHADKLKRDISLNFEETRDIFVRRRAQEDLEINKALEDVRRHYHNDMKTHFGNNKFITPDQLQEFHESASTAAVNNCTLRTALNESQQNRLADLLKESFVKYKNQNDLYLNWDPKVEPAIGIDLGTTHCCVGVFLKGKVHIIPNELGSNTTPSYVAFEGRKSKTIGQPAKDNSYRNPENTIFDAKRIIGRAFNDSELQKDMKFWPFDVVQGETGPAIKIRGEKYPPEKISSILLSHFKEMAEKYLGRKVTKAVITVPAYFNDGQRQATVDAGFIAGLDVLTILNEPTAAAIAYQLERFDEEARKILIFDLGGGTFDVAVLDVVAGSIQVLGVEGDTHLGGEDFDKKMMEYCAEEFKRQHKLDLFHDKDSGTKTLKDAARQRLRRLQTHCEKSKKDLAAARSTTISADALLNGQDLHVKITRAKFEELNLELFQKAIDIVDRALSTVGIRKERIDDIVLVGGSTRIPKVQEMLKDYFNGKALTYSVNPDEAVAYGAAVQAALLNGTKAKETLGFTSIQDVTPMSLGISAFIKKKYGQFSIIIPKNTKFPAKHTELYRTMYDNQTDCKIKIYQGEDPSASKNTLLGQFVLEGVPAAPAGAEAIDISMEIDAMGILHVTALCKSTRGSKTLTVTTNKGRLSQKTKERWRSE